MRLRMYRPRTIILIFCDYSSGASMKSASFIFDRRLYELLQEEGRSRFTTRELRDAYAKHLDGMTFRIGDVRRYVYEQIRRMLRMGWVVLDEERRSRGQVYHLQPIPAHLQLELIDNGFENSHKTACEPEQEPSAFDNAAVPQPSVGFYPISTDGLKRAENFRSCRATLRRIRGL